MKNILGKRTLITGPVSSFASAISIAVLATAAEDNGAVVAFVVDDQSGVSILQQFGLFEKITGHHNPRLSLEIVKPALTQHAQITALKTVEPRDGREFIVARYFDRNLAPLTDGDLWLEWQSAIAQNLHCRTLTVAHWGSMPIPAPLDHKHWDRCWVIEDNHTNIGGRATERVGEPRRLVCLKPSPRTVPLLGKSHVGAIIFSEIVKENA
jgi:hypothetical protein